MIAAVLALVAAWAGRLYVAERAQASLLRDQERLAQLELRAVRNQAEAERIVAQRQLADERARSAEFERQLRESRAKAGASP